MTLYLTLVSLATLLVGAIGAALLDRYLLAFELASVLLLVAFVGAIALVREEGEE